VRAARSAWRHCSLSLAVSCVTAASDIHVGLVLRHHIAYRTDVITSSDKIPKSGRQQAHRDKGCNIAPTNGYFALTLLGYL